MSSLEMRVEALISPLCKGVLSVPPCVPRTLSGPGHTRAKQARPPLPREPALWRAGDSRCCGKTARWSEWGRGGAGALQGKSVDRGERKGRQEGLLTQVLAPMSCLGNQGGEGSRGRQVR